MDMKREIFSWLPVKIAQAVPDQIAVCEYDCRTPKCTVGHWETCERRINGLQASTPLEMQRDQKISGSSAVKTCKDPGPFDLPATPTAHPE
jgi:hypothetical protein